MEITLGDKTYKSGKTRLKTIRKLVQLSEKIQEFEEAAQSDDEEKQLKLIETIHPVMELNDNIRLIVEYFGNQFTEEEFLEGYTVDSMQDFAKFVYELIVEAILGITLPVTEKK